MSDNLQEFLRPRIISGSVYSRNPLRELGIATNGLMNAFCKTGPYQEIHCANAIGRFATAAVICLAKMDARVVSDPVTYAFGIAGSTPSTSVYDSIQKMTQQVRAAQFLKEKIRDGLGLTGSEDEEFLKALMQTVKLSIAYLQNNHEVFKRSVARFPINYDDTMVPKPESMPTAGLALAAAASLPAQPSGRAASPAP